MAKKCEQMESNLWRAKEGHQNSAVANRVRHHYATDTMVMSAAF